MFLPNAFKEDLWTDSTWVLKQPISLCLPLNFYFDKIIVLSVHLNLHVRQSIGSITNLILPQVEQLST